MSLTYGDVPLNFPDPEGELHRWLCHYLPTLDLFTAPPVHVLGSDRMLRRRMEVDKGIGLPTITWPARPPLSINTLYWPTGATRWAFGVFLATKDNKDQIVKKAHPQGSGSAEKGNSVPLALKWHDGSQDKLETKLYLLPPRQVSGIDESKHKTASTLWLLPLVDVRYWWQYTPVANPAVTSASGWDDHLYITIGQALDVGIGGDPVAAAYLKPDPVEFNRRHVNAAALLDATAVSSGQRIVRRLKGEVEALNPPSKFEPPAGHKVVSGGEFSKHIGDLPKSLTVTFRKITCRCQHDDGAVYPLTKEGADGGTSERKVTIASAALADFEEGASVPLNHATLDALATKLAADWFKWRKHRFAYTLRGATDWKLTGLEDAIAWQFGSIGPDGALQCQTKVCSLPPIVESETNAAADPSKFLIDPVVRPVKKLSNEPDPLTGFFPGKVICANPLTKTKDELADIWIWNLND